MKRQLRVAMRTAVRIVNGDSSEIRRQADAWLHRNPGRRVVAAFHPTTGEPDLTELTAEHPERTWVFPSVRGGDLDFRVVQSPMDDLQPGAFGILEPRPHLAIIDVAEINVFFCPGLAFDRSGYRLGRGKGFYDRILSRARPDAVRIGVGFPCQMVENTFPEAHDQKMDLVFCGLPSHPLGHDEPKLWNAGEDPLPSGCLPEECT